jgi:hypothetical protein
VQAVGVAEEEINRHADERVLRDPFALSPALAVERPADPGQFVQLVGPEAEFLALEPLPLGSL